MAEIVTQNTLPRHDRGDASNSSSEYDSKIQMQFDRVQSLRLKYLESVALEESSHQK